VTFAPAGRVVVVTGGAGGIGRAFALEAAIRGARAIVVCDIDHERAAAVAAEVAARHSVPASAFDFDVSEEPAVTRAIEEIETAVGPVDLWCSNAGVKLGLGLGNTEQWERSVAVNVMSHVHMARHVVPRMLARGHGHVVITTSAAGLLSSPESAPYAVTTHACVALAEWLTIRYGDEGLGVTCVCPQAVGKPMNTQVPDALAGLAAGSVTPEQVARDVFDGLSAGQFLVLPHPRVAEYERRRAADRQRWLTGMRRAAGRSPSQPPTTASRGA
jgi:NAD(P)-dependent dehydrogenase (short-subunit alcohol dehydrogenase family)